MDQVCWSRETCSYISYNGVGLARYTIWTIVFLLTLVFVVILGKNTVLNHFHSEIGHMYKKANFPVWVSVRLCVWGVQNILVTKTSWQSKRIQLSKIRSLISSLVQSHLHLKSHFSSGKITIWCILCLIFLYQLVFSGQWSSTEGLKHLESPKPHYNLKE